MNIQVITFSIDKKIQSLSFPWGSQEDTQTNGDFPYKCKCKYLLEKSKFYWLSPVSDFVCLFVSLKHNQLKISLVPKKHILEWQILPPFTIQNKYYYINGTLVDFELYKFNYSFKCCDRYAVSILSSLQERTHFPDLGIGVYLTASSLQRLPWWLRQ